ncbi:Arm DNA-binding domain-containing protein [Bacteroides heparinolyticus]|uniref:Arm DNA-binding domain-containing protein n=1 Tax=Prevotella heparinolytica TaxID=28113 RepID=UPI0035A190A9
MSESKEPIRLRQRKMPTGNISLYLNIYLNGKRTYEYLKMYLIPEQTRADREKNKETLKLADAVRAKRVIELRNGQYGFKNTTSGKLRFFDYYRELCEKRLGEVEKPINFDPFGSDKNTPLR